MKNARWSSPGACARSIARGLGIRVFSGLECDILKDGAMDLANDALAELDLVIGSVHSHMNQEVGRDDGPPAARARVSAPAHPRTSHRPHAAAPRPVPFDFDRVAAEAVRRGVWLEINASPERLDLHGALIRTAKRQGREVHHLYRRASSQASGAACVTACVTARRGWLGPDDILNTRGAGEFARAIQAKS